MVQFIGEINFSKMDKTEVFIEKKDELKVDLKNSKITQGFKLASVHLLSYIFVEFLFKKNQLVLSKITYEQIQKFNAAGFEDESNLKEYIVSFFEELVKNYNNLQIGRFISNSQKQDVCNLALYQNLEMSSFSYFFEPGDKSLIFYGRKDLGEEHDIYGEVYYKKSCYNYLILAKFKHEDSIIKIYFENYEKSIPDPDFLEKSKRHRLKFLSKEDEAKEIKKYLNLGS